MFLMWDHKANTDFTSTTGPVCWELCPKTFPASEGALCCFTDSSCNKKAVQMAQAVIAAVIAAGKQSQQLIG